MPAPEQEITEQERKKRTVWLLAGGAASLLIPLLGALYLHWSATSGAPGPSGRNDVFERRDGGEKHITPSQTAVPASVMATPPSSSLPAAGRTERSAGSSLDFVKSNQDMTPKPAEQPKPATAVAAAPTPAPPPEPAPAAPSKTKAKKGKKDFSAPKLQPSRGFTNFNSGKSGKGNAAPAAAGAAGGGDMQDMLKNLPPGAENNPEVQKYLKQQGK